MPSKAKRDKERRWKLARNAVWGCVPARLVSELPATWVPATELVPGGERAPWSSRTWCASVLGAGQEAWAQVGATGVDECSGTAVVGTNARVVMMVHLSSRSP